MFRGSYPAKIDEKGRLKLPSDFRVKVEEAYGGKFFITASLEIDSAQLYPLAVWEEIERELKQFETANGFIGPCEMIVAVGEKK